MADDKGIRGATDTAANSAGSEPEARILEEVIVRPAPSPAAPLAAPKISVPPPAPSPPPPSVSPEKKLVVPPPPQQGQTGPTETSLPAMTIGTFMPTAAPPTEPEKKPEPPPREPARVPPAVQQPISTNGIDISSAPRTKSSTDMGEMLKGIKLPERRALPGSEQGAEKQKAYDTSLMSSLSDESKKILGETPAAPVASETPATSPSGSAASIVAPLRTLKNDFQDIVRDKKISLVSAASLEQDKKRSVGRFSEERENTVRKSHRSLRIIVATILLLLLGTGVFFGIAVIMEERRGTVAGPSDSSLLFAESAVALPLENLNSFDIKSLLSQMRGASGALGSITRVVPTVRTTPTDTEVGGPREATLAEFLSALDVRASSNLVRALGDEFFFGIHTVDKNAPVFVIPVISYERAFAGMLEWEQNMSTDLAPAFTAVRSTFIGPSGLLERRQFEDLIMRNYDTRALKDDSGTIQLFYAFPTRNILIIAESPYSFVEVLARLRAERRL